MTHSHIYFKKRLDKFRAFFPQLGVEGFVIENPTDIAYFTGLNFSKGRLLIGSRGVTLFVDGRYRELAKKGSPYPVKELTNSSLSEVLKRWKGVKRYGFDTGLSVAAYRALKKVFVKQTLKGIDSPTAVVRSIKDRSELALLQKSADLVWKGFLHLRKKLKEGVRECDLAWEFEFYVKREGAEALSFKPIVAFGENSAFPHHKSGIRKLKRGDVVLIDIGVVLNGYASDMTRTVFFGEVPKRLQEMYKIVRKAHKAATEACAAGVKMAHLEEIARTVMGKEEKYFIHSLGHGIGLDVHEFPRISKHSQKEVLKEGMVITVEPGLYLPEMGGIRHEDMIVITKTGHRNFFTL